MKTRRLMPGIPIALCTMLLLTSLPGCISSKQQSAAVPHAGKQAAAKQEMPKAVGKIVGVSKKAKTITIADKKMGNVMIRFDEATEGLEHAMKGEAAIINFRMADEERIATVIKPKLAKLPKNVTVIKPEELASLMDSGSDLMLIDSRPGKRYAEGHIQTATSAPVAKLEKEFATILPFDNKDKLLIFYCGGPT